MLDPLDDAWTVRGPCMDDAWTMLGRCLDDALPAVRRSARRARRRRSPHISSLPCYRPSVNHLRYLSAAVALVLLTFCAQASAQNTKEYDDTIARAVAEFDHGNWEEARVLFRRAHDANPNARTWRSLGVTAFELRRYVDAIAELEASLADPRKPLTTKQRSEVEGLLTRAREFVSVYRVKISPADAEVLVDGKVVTLTDGKLFLDPGQHTVVVRAGGYRERREDLSVAAGVQDELSLELSVAGETETTNVQPAAGPLAAQPQPESAEAAPARGRRPRIWTWVLAGTAVAVAGAAVGTGVAARGKLDDYKKCETKCGAIQKSGERLQLITNLTFGVSGAVLAGAVLAFFLEDRSDTTQRATTVSIGPDGVGLSQRF